MRSGFAQTAMLVVALLTAAQTAHAHGIAGNRYFDGKLTFDDPAVATEVDRDQVPHAGHDAGKTIVVERGSHGPEVHVCARNGVTERANQRHRAAGEHPPVHGAASITVHAVAARDRSGSDPRACAPPLRP